MLEEKYLNKIKEKIIQFNQGKDLKFFIFGSSLNKKHFGDLDLGVVGDINDKELYKLKEDFTESTLPYAVDVVNFNKVEEEFRKNVFNNKILWIVP